MNPIRNRSLKETKNDISKSSVIILDLVDLIFLPNNITIHDSTVRKTECINHRLSQTEIIHDGRVYDHEWPVDKKYK